MRIAVADIRAVHTYESETALDVKNVLGAPPDYVEFNSPIQARVKATISGDDILVSGKAAVKATLCCGKCLEKYEWEIKADFSQAVEASIETLDLVPEIRESLLVELPVRFICKETCKGICEKCGINKNVSECGCSTHTEYARWDILKKMKFK